jgi:integrase
MGFRERNWASEAIIIKRSDVERVHEYAREHASPRDFLLIRLPMKIGLRTSEIRTLKIENINFHERSFMVLDSKKYTFFPLPLDVLTLQLIQDLNGMKNKGYVFEHKNSWTYTKKDQPLSRVQIWTIIHEIAEKAGVPGFNPRILRHYFAAMYLREQEEKPGWIKKRRRTLETLRKILRHSHLGVTQIYLSKLTFFEDMQEEYESVQNEPFEEFPDIIEKFSQQNQLYRQLCAKCKHEPICKFKEQLQLSPWAEGCRFYAPKIEVLNESIAIKKS